MPCATAPAASHGPNPIALLAGLGLPLGLGAIVFLILVGTAFLIAA